MAGGPAELVELVFLPGKCSEDVACGFHGRRGVILGDGGAQMGQRGVPKISGLAGAQRRKIPGDGGSRKAEQLREGNGSPAHGVAGCGRIDFGNR